MRTGIKSQHFDDINGNPAGGTTYGDGFTIGWQNGPLGRHSPACRQEVGAPCTMICAPDCTRKPQNGAFVEDVIEAAADRIRYYQRSKFACGTNQRALQHLEAALYELNSRTSEREVRKVEGTHQA